jgi:hypothetical protein
MAGAWIDYISRCQGLLQQGRHVADICYFMGEDIPARALRPDMLRPPLPAGYAYDSINADALWTLARVRDGRIEVPAGASYSVMVIQPGTAITLRTARKLKELVVQGATLFGPRPSVVPSLQDKAAMGEADAILTELWGGRVHPGRVIASGDLATVLRKAGLGPDVDAPPDIRWVHRAEPDRDIYFLSNQHEAQHEAAQVATIRLRTRHRRVVSYDPVSDRRAPVATRVDEDDHAVVSVDLPIGGSVFLLFEQGAALPAPRIAQGFPPAQPIIGPWTVLFDNVERNALSGVERLRSWTEEEEPAIRFHSGIARYRATFRHMPKKGVNWRLDLGEVHDVAQVRVNGHELGTIWQPGTLLELGDLLRRGENLIEIAVANSWRNRLIGDQQLPQTERRSWVLQNRLGRSGPILPAADAPLLPAGLIGPVRLVPCVAA